MDLKQQVQEVYERWREDFSNRDPNKRGSELDYDDYGIVAAYVQSKFEDGDPAVFLFRMFEKEFTRGDRCMVCGNTKAQNEALGYDCFTGC